MKTIYILFLALFFSHTSFAQTINPIAGLDSFCVGQANIYSDATTGGAWSSSSTSIATISSAGILYGISGGTTTITYTAGPTYATKTVTINTLPRLYHVRLGPPGIGAICGTSGVAIMIDTSDIGINYDAMMGTALMSAMVSGTGSALSFIENAVGTYHVYGTNAVTGCMSRMNDSGTLYAGTIPPPIAGLPFICLGSSITFSDATPGGIWSSTFPSIASVSGYGVVSGISAGTATIYYMVGSGCNTTKTVTVTTTPCSGMPVPGTMDAIIGCSGAPDTLTISGISPLCGISVQWQTSPDGVTWNDISGATELSYIFSASTSAYYRNEVTCSLSGLSAYSNNQFVYDPVVAGHVLHSTIHNPIDTLCSSVDFYTSTCDSSSSYNVMTEYGDGQTSLTPLTLAGVICEAHILHSYSLPGTYFVKQVLLNSSTPVDSVTFSYEYSYCNTLPLKIYDDFNNNCIRDSGEPLNISPVTIIVDSNGITIDTISVTSGFYYHAAGAVGTIYGFRILPASGMYANCPSSGILYDTIQSLVNNYPVKYFGLNCTGSGFDLAEYAGIQCGRHAAYGTISISDLFCTPETATLTMNFSPKYSYYLAYPAPSSYSGTTITWNISNVSSETIPTVIKYGLVISTTWLIPGDTVNSSFTLAPITGDANPSNNIETRVDTVKSSYDPNEMSVMPGGYISSGTNLQYTINFENTGNDTAHNIYVMDTLSDNVDIHSMKILAASSVMNLAIFNIGGHNIVKFDFPGIMLPDSSHHNQCDGMVVFKINTLNGLPNGTTIFNHAGIFFDDNPVVMTDTVEDIISIPAGIATNSNYRTVEIYPNPTTGNLNIQWQNQLTGSADAIITDVLGREVYTSTISVNAPSGQTQMELQGLKDGVYLFTLKNSSIYSCKKFVVQH